MERTVRLETVFNMRDVGGVVTRSGQVIKKGLLFRSDALSALSTADVAELRNCTIRTLLDLRSAFELNRQGPSLLTDHGATHHHVPIMDGNMDEQGIRVRPDTVAELYANMIDREGSTFATIFRLLADPANLPAIVHCTAGKDRTGVTVALLYGLLDVPTETIIADYAITDDNMASLIAFTRGLGREVGKGAPPHFVRAEAKTMDAFLKHLETRYGNAEAYLLGAGVTMRQVDSLRDIFLVPDGDA